MGERALRSKRTSRAFIPPWSRALPMVGYRHCVAGGSRTRHPLRTLRMSENGTGTLATLRRSCRTNPARSSRSRIKAGGVPWPAGMRRKPCPATGCARPAAMPACFGSGFPARMTPHCSAPGSVGHSDGAKDAALRDRPEMAWRARSCCHVHGCQCRKCRAAGRTRWLQLRRPEAWPDPCHSRPCACPTTTIELEPQRCPSSTSQGRPAP